MIEELNYLVMPPDIKLQIEKRNMIKRLVDADLRTHLFQDELQEIAHSVLTVEEACG